MGGYGTSGYGGLGNGVYDRYTGLGGYNSYTSGYGGYNTLNGYPSYQHNTYSRFGSGFSPSTYSRILSSYSTPQVTYPYGGIGTVGVGGGSSYSNGGYIY